VRKHCLAIKQQGYRFQKWFMPYGPGSGSEGLRKNVELVRILRETVGDDTELMFDAFSGWDLTYAQRWAREVEQYHPRWIEEAMPTDQLESFATLRRSTSIPVATGEHFFGRWEADRFLNAQAVSVIQADPDWCGGISELIKIGTLASVHDIPVVPHGHGVHAALHTIASQSPATFPMAEYLLTRMPTFYYFEKRPPIPVNGRFPLPTGPGFNIEINPAVVESQHIITGD
jgi:L-alanine-DL-glutamate epimerase-like enolase superfamily enzyme